ADSCLPRRLYPPRRARPWARPLPRAALFRRLRSGGAVGGDGGAAAARVHRSVGELSEAGRRLGAGMGSHHSEPEPWVVHRVRALESLLIEKGLLSTEVVDTVVQTYEKDVGPMNGAKVVRRAWADPPYRHA